MAASAAKVLTCCCAQIPYAGREQSASPATGYSGIHKQQQEKLVKDALDLDFEGRWH